MFNTDTSRSLLDRLRSTEQVRDWETFCEIYQPFIQRHLLARNIRPADLDDQVQEVLLRLTKSLPGFQHNGHTGAFRKWLGSLISQQAWRYFTKRDGEQTFGSGSYSLLESQPTEDSLMAQWESEHDSFIVQRMLVVIRREFTETTWQAFQLLTLESLTADEAAARLGISANAAVIAKSRVLRRLRVLGKDLIDRF